MLSWRDQEVMEKLPLRLDACMAIYSGGVISSPVVSSYCDKDNLDIHRMSASIPIVRSGSPIFINKNLAKLGSDGEASLDSIPGLHENRLTSDSLAKPSTKYDSRDKTGPNKKIMRMPEIVPEGIPVE